MDVISLAISGFTQKLGYSMIKNIKFKLEGYTDKHVEIELGGKNLILTGANGCGKTRFLNQFYDLLTKRLERHIESESNLLAHARNYENTLRGMNVSDPSYPGYKTAMKSCTEKLERLKNNHVYFDNDDEIFELVNTKQIIVHLFEAHRLADNIASQGSIGNLTGLRTQGKNVNIYQKLNQYFEEYLVAYYNYASHVIAREKNPEKTKNIEDWFNKTEKDIQTLFEDDNLKLIYNPEESVFYIHQEGKDPFRFSQLSSGYTAILNIYAELLMKVELKEIPADKIKGFVFIDEIDVHLHVSIQRKIFKFFSEVFPNIQFIITTHSPFVIQSVDDAIIYDLSKNEQLEDLSMYSYEAILKGLLGVDISSEILNAHVDELVNLMEQNPINWDRLDILIKEIEPDEDKLDVRSQAFLALAKNKRLDSKEA